MQDDDAELVAAHKAGDAHALETLYWRHAERVWRYARYFSRNDDEAAEIAQETFARVVQSLGNFYGRAKFSTWLFSIVRSAAVKHCINLRRRPQVPEEDFFARVPGSGLEPSVESEAGETRAAVRKAIARLPEHEREAVLLCEIEDLSLHEAGQVLGWEESRLKVTLFRARRHLKDMLEPHVSRD
jgi:RNA polymerase sigma-70 factor (ECF subfamily)